MFKYIFLTVLSVSAQARDWSAYLQDNEKSLDQLTQSTAYENEIRILNLGMVSRPNRLTMISEAERFILMKMPYWFNDEAGNQHVEALRTRKNQNPSLDIKIFFDWFTMGQSRQMFDKVIKHKLVDITGHQLLTWNPLTWQRDFSFKIWGNRMHDKVFVVDGESAIIGGMNIANKYMFGGESREGWHDTDVLIRGPGVHDITRYFLIDWELTKLFRTPQSFPIGKKRVEFLKNVYRNNEQSYVWKTLEPNSKGLVTKTIHVPFIDNYDASIYYPRQVQLDNERTFLSRVIYDNGLVDKDSKNNKYKSKIAATARFLLSSAESHVRAIAPYLTISSEMKKAWISALKRGVRVQIITNSMVSHDLGNHAYYGASMDMLELMRAGAELYEWIGHSDLYRIEKENGCKIKNGWHGHTIHTKGIVFDDQVTLLGSHNFNYRSEHHNNEIAVLVDSAQVAQEFSEIFIAALDLDKSRHYVQCGDRLYTRAPKTRRLRLDEFEKFVKENKGKINFYRKFKFIL